MIRVHERIAAEKAGALDEQSRVSAARDLRLQEERPEALAERLNSSTVALNAQQALIESMELLGHRIPSRYWILVSHAMEPPLQINLFSGAAIHCDEQFNIIGIIRELQQTETFDGLSVGTQEQIAVLTRLAIADMLLERGKPATVILDDALVYSDTERMERMFDLLTHAAQRTQILILTCRGDLFTRLGGTRLRVIAE